MAQLETITQTFQTNTAQSQAALEALQREYIQTGQVSAATTKRAADTFSAFGAGMSRRSTEVARSTALMRGGFQNLGFQIQDVIVQLQAGQNAFQIFAQQGSQIASIFGPMGAGIGIAIAAMGGLGSVLLSSGKEAEEADEILKELIGTLDDLGGRDEELEKLVQRLGELRGEAQRLGQIQVEFAVEDIKPKLDAAKEELRTFLQEMITAVEAPAAQVSMERGVPLQEIIRRAPEVIAPFTPEHLQSLHDLQQGMEAGSVSGAALAEALIKIGIEMGGLFQDDDRRRAADLATEIENLANQLGTAATAASRIDFQRLQGGAGVGTGGLRDTPFSGQKPPGMLLPPPSPAAPTAQRAEFKRLAELPTFEKIVGPIEQENALLKEGLLTREEIKAILQAEKTLKRDLIKDEKLRLAAAMDVNAALVKGQQEAEKQAKLSADQTEKLQDQVDAAQLLNKFGGVETAEYERQLGLLKLKQAGVENITEEQRDLNAQLIKERQEIQRNNALRGQASEREQLGLQRKFMGENLFAQQFTGAEAEEFRVQAEMARERQQQGLPAGAALPEGMETSIRQTERMRTELEFMELAATTAGEAMSDLITESLFGEGPEAAAQRFTQALAEMALQAALTQLAVVALNAAMAGGTAPAGQPGMTTGAGNTTGAGGAGFSYTGYGGPRQHGGPVRSNTTYMVGERGPEMFVPRSSGSIVPNSQLGGGGGVTIIDQRGRGAPAVETNVDAKGMITAVIRGEVGSMMRDGTMNRGIGVPRKGIARG